MDVRGVGHSLDIKQIKFILCVWFWCELFSWWRHQMEIFSALLGPLCGGWPVNSPHKGRWRGTLMFSLISALNKRISKQSWGWWFETPLLWPLLRHCNMFWLFIIPFFSWMPHWHWFDHAITPVPVKQPWIIWVKRPSRNKPTKSANQNG